MTNLNNIVRYGEPLRSWFRRRNRGFAGVNYDGGSSQLAAMNAHLRAAAYREGEFRSSPGSKADGAQAGALEIASLPMLLRQYDNQARSNFAGEALLFAIITAIGFVWPIAHTLRVLAP